MLGKKVHLILVVAAIALAFEAPTRAQSPVASRADDPVVSARERIESAVERHAAIAERVLAASKLLNESIAAESAENPNAPKPSFSKLKRSSPKSRRRSRVICLTKWRARLPQSAPL